MGVDLGLGVGLRLVVRLVVGLGVCATVGVDEDVGEVGKQTGSGDTFSTWELPMVRVIGEVGLLGRPIKFFHVVPMVREKGLDNDLDT